MLFWILISDLTAFALSNKITACVIEYRMMAWKYKTLLQREQSKCGSQCGLWLECVHTLQDNPRKFVLHSGNILFPTRQALSKHNVTWTENSEGFLYCELWQYICCYLFFLHTAAGKNVMCVILMPPSLFAFKQTH